MVHFRKAIPAQILGGIVVFVLIFVGLENAVATNYIPQLLDVEVNTKKLQALKFQALKLQAFNGLVTKIQKNYGDAIQILERHPPPYRFPYLRVRVEQGMESVWISKLKQVDPIIGEVKRVENSKTRLPTGTHQFLVKAGNKTAFENIDKFVIATFKEKCGYEVDCILPHPAFPRYKKFSIAYLNKEIIPDQDLVEVLEITFVSVDEDGMDFTTIVNGKYASADWKGKKLIPPGAFQDMAVQYFEQLKAYTDEVKKKLKAYR